MTTEAKTAQTPQTSRILLLLALLPAAQLHSVEKDEASTSFAPSLATTKGEMWYRSPSVPSGLTFTFWSMGPSTLLGLEFHLRSRPKMVVKATQLPQHLGQ